MKMISFLEDVLVEVKTACVILETSRAGTTTHGIDNIRYVGSKFNKHY